MWGLAATLFWVSIFPNTFQQGTADDYFLGPRKSPDGKWEAFTEVHRDQNGFGDVSDVSLYISNGRTRRRLIKVNGDRDVPVTAGWSPDSRRILYWSLLEYGSSSVNADGSGLRDVSINGGRSRSLGFAMRKSESFCFSPNGKYLAVVEGFDRFPGTNKRIAVFEYRFGRQKYVTSRRMASIDPRWSPDSARLAFVATKDEHPPRDTDDRANRRHLTHLWVVDYDGTHRRELTNDPRYHEDGPRWSIDGRTIRFQRSDNWNGGYLSDWEIRADGTGLRQVSKSSK